MLNLDFALVVFSLTIVALVAIVYGKDNLAGKALDIFSGVLPRLPGLKALRKSEGPKKLEDAAATEQSPTSLQ